MKRRIITTTKTKGCCDDFMDQLQRVFAVVIYSSTPSHIPNDSLSCEEATPLITSTVSNVDNRSRYSFTR